MQLIRHLSDINLKRDYDPAKDGCDLVASFYIPCLSVSNRYDRMSAYFSPAVLRSFAKGLHNFFVNKGHIRFIFSCEIGTDEMADLEQSYRRRFDDISSGIDDSRELLANDFEISNLSYLIEHGLAEVKIAFMVRERVAIFHGKEGIFADEQGNKVYFCGSGNETVAGLCNNSEQFKVFCNFKSEEQAADVKTGEDKFEAIWNNSYSPESIRAEFPVGALYERLKSFSRGKVFNSSDEYYSDLECVVVDVDCKNELIVLSDFTKIKILSNPMILSSNFYENWTTISDNVYSVKQLDLRTFRDRILKVLDTFNITYILTDNACEYLKNNDLEIQKREKLGLSIKNNELEGLWRSDYYAFKGIVDEQTAIALKEKQMLDAFFHYQMVSSANYSVPGTGKTYIAYGLFAYLSSKYCGKVDRLVVIGPLNCFDAWETEGKKIFNGKRNLTFYNHHHHLSDYKEVLARQKFDVYLFNYEFFDSYFDLKFDILSNEVLTETTLLVLDEAHRIKSVSGTRANNVVTMLSHCKRKPVYRLVLTGTPMPNSFRDIYNYMRILYPDDLANVFPSISEYTLKKADTDKREADAIRKALYPIFVRTTKYDLNIPPADPDDFVTHSINSSFLEPVAFKQEHRT